MESSEVQQYRLAFVQSLWHDDIVGQARDGFLGAVGDRATVETFEVPGAFELPLHVRTVAESGRFDAVVAAGFVVDGGIYRHEFVADAVISGLMRVQLDVGVPVFSSVLTPQQFHESDDHRAFFSQHMVGKGREVAASCLATLDARASLIAA
jgi:6,7-dimethyl-8-ribityllumazine synthase